MLILDPKCEFMSEQLTCLSTPSCGTFLLPMKQRKTEYQRILSLRLFQKIPKNKQSVHIPFRKTSSISSHGRLSNWNDASDDKSMCVSVCERQLGTTVIGSQTCSQMHNMSNPLVCICVNSCIIQDFKLYTWMVSIYMYSTYTYKTNEPDFSYTAWHRKGSSAYTLSI